MTYMTYWTYIAAGVWSGGRRLTK